MDWSPEIKIKLQTLLNSNEREKIAVFDADGTLWYGDLGESFFKYQIANRLAPAIATISDPLAHYRGMDRTNTISACSWLAEINKGLRAEEVREHAQIFYEKKFSSKPTAPVRKLIRDLHAHDFEVWICTASPRYSVEPCLAELEIPPHRILGAEVEIDLEGFLTDRPIVPVPYKEGKKLALEKTLSAQPLLVVGNSLGDLEMLKWAKLLALGINYLPRLAPVRLSEEELAKECHKRGWPLQIFNMV